LKNKHIMIAIFIVFLWGFNFVALKITVTYLPPIFSAAFRFLLISIPWIFIFKKPKITVFQFITIPLTLGVFQYSLLYYGMSLGLSSGLSAVVLQTQAFFAVFFASVLMKEKLKSREIYGLIVGASGVLILFLLNDGDFKIESVLIILIAAISLGIANIQLKGLGDINMVSFLIWMSPIASILLFIISYIFEFDDIKNIEVTKIELKVIVSVLYTAYFSYVVGFTLWQYLLNKYNSVKVTPFGLLVPITGSLFGFLFLGEIIEWYQVLSGIIIMSGLMLIINKQNKE
jgi:O-acetylserine/cysteine efflux transporter